MDVKSLAKSKRAHSQHHSKKHHPNQKPKAPSTGSTGAASPNKPQGKQIKEKSPQFQSSSALSSNWDRYEEDFDSALDDPSQSNSSQPSDVILRKSKGADYSYLISEAKSHSYATSSSMSFPSFDDIFNDFNQGVGALVSVRGESILSRTQNDNFVVEDQSTTNVEASFLSLELNSIAKQLAKLDLSQRLFIEEEEDIILLQELSTATATSTAALDQDIEIQISSSGTAANSTAPTTSATATPTTTTAPSTDPNMHSVSNHNKSPKFEAVAAEAELDMLLDSFNQTNFLDPSRPATIDQTTLNGRDLSESTLALNLDSAIDDLLNETSVLVHKENASPPINVPDLSRPIAGPNLDASIDDLLNETSSSGLMNKNDADVLTNPSKSKILDDFDLWLDTI